MYFMKAPAAAAIMIIMVLVAEVAVTVLDQPVLMLPEVAGFLLISANQLFPQDSLPYNNFQSFRLIEDFLDV